MINKIIDRVFTQLNDGFGEEYEIYTESMKQGIEKPCFFISCINFTNEQVKGNKYFRNNSFCIQYFPSSDKPRSECNKVLEKLLLTLEYIEVDSNLVKGTKMHGEIVDDILSLFVNYDMFIYKIEPETTPMEELKIVQVNMKG